MRGLFGKPHRKAIVLGVAALAAVGLFAGGALAGFVIDDDGDSDGEVRTVLVNPFNNAQNAGFPGTSAEDAAAGDVEIPLPTPPPGAASGAGWAPAPAGDRDHAAGVAYSEEMRARSAMSIYPYPMCQGDIDGIVDGNVIDPGLLGLSMNLLGDGYTLQSISIRSEGECDENGNVIDSHPVVDSTWLHEETGFQVYVSQRLADEPTSNVKENGYATFWADGYAYSVSVNAYYAYDMPRDAVVEPAYPGEVDPAESEALLNEVIAELAPGLDQACFYTLGTGTWDDLTAAGIGDPRPAIPPEYVENYFDFRTYVPPPEDCGVPAPEGYGTSFSASWYADGVGGISVSAYQMAPSSDKYPGYIDDWSAYWTNGDWQFSIYGDKGGVGLGYDTIVAIATALDPGFADACLLENVTLTEAEFAALGFGLPVVPEGYVLNSSSFSTQTASGDCSDVPYLGGSNGWWSYSDTANNIDVSVWRAEGDFELPEGPNGSISDNYLSWMDATGTSYSVSGYSMTGTSAGPGRDVLVAVALSLDPTLDPSTLPEAPVGPYPVAVEETAVN
jgi:hypothetical protein